MDLNPQLDLQCPTCNVKIGQKVQRRMNRFWTGLQPTECEGCGCILQWHHLLHKKFKIGGSFFRTGIGLAVIAISLYVTEWKSYSVAILAVSISMIAAGVLTTYTPRNAIKVESVDKT